MARHREENARSAERFQTMFWWNHESMMLEISPGSRFESETKSPQRAERERWFFKYIFPNVRRLDLTQAMLNLPEEEFNLWVAQMEFFQDEETLEVCLALFLLGMDGC